MLKQISRLFNPASAVGTASSQSAHTTAASDAIQQQIALQEQQVKQLRDIEAYKAKVLFLCESLWPDHGFEVFVITDQARMLYQVQMRLMLDGEPLVFQWCASMYPTGIFGPVPREVIAQINMVTA